MTREEAVDRFGVDPDSIGHNKCGWCVVDDTLIVMTKDKRAFEKGFNVDSKFTKYETFMYVSGDVLDKTIQYYYYRPIGAPKRAEEIEPEDNSHAAMILKSMREQDERAKHD